MYRNKFETKWQQILIVDKTLQPALPNIVAICYKWYADFNVIIAIVTTNSLFAKNKSNVVEWETVWQLYQFRGTF